VTISGLPIVLRGPPAGFKPSRKGLMRRASQDDTMATIRVKAFMRFALLLAVLSCSRPAGAQDQRPYVSAAIDFSPVGIHSWSGSPSLTYTNATDDTVVMGILGEGGVPLGSNTAFGVEINIPFRRTDITQSHGYFNPYKRLSRYQEWTLFGLFHGYLVTSRRVRAGIMAGGGFVFASSLDRISLCNFDAQIPCSPFSPEQEATHTSVGATIGGDLVIQATRHLGVVPQFRVVWTGRGGEPASSISDHDFVTLGLNRLTYHAAIGLRATF